MSDPAVSNRLAVGAAVLQVALVVVAVLAVAGVNRDDTSGWFDAGFGVASVGMIAVVVATLLVWPGRPGTVAKVAAAVTIVGLTWRIVGSIYDVLTPGDPVALIVSSFPPMFLGLLVLGICLVRATGTHDWRGWMPLAAMVSGFLIGNLRAISPTADFAACGFVWAPIWVCYALAVRGPLTPTPPRAGVLGAA